MKAKLNNVRNAGTLLAQAKADLEVAETRLANLKVALGRAEANLTYLRSLLPNHFKGEPAYHELPALEIPKELLDKVDAKVDGKVDGKVDTKVDTPVVTVPLTTTQVASSVPVPAPVVAPQTEPAKVAVEYNTLPVTGETENIMLYIGIGLLGLAGLSKKK